MKANKERTSKVVSSFIKHVKWGAAYAEIEAPIIAALDKAEKRGQRKEHKRSGIYDGSRAVADREGYRSEGEPYDVELTRDGTKVTARVWDMPEEVRGEHGSRDVPIIEDGNYNIRSKTFPYITSYTLWLWGTGKEMDSMDADDTFPTVTAARDYFTHITALLDKLNAEYKPVQRKSIHCPACGMLIALVPLPEMNREPAPQFDAEKVRGLVDTLMRKCQMVELFKPSAMFMRDVVNTDMNNAEAALLTALGIDE